MFATNNFLRETLNPDIFGDYSSKETRYGEITNPIQDNVIIFNMNQLMKTPPTYNNTHKLSQRIVRSPMAQMAKSAFAQATENSPNSEYGPRKGTNLNDIKSPNVNREVHWESAKIKPSKITLTGSSLPFISLNAGSGQNPTKKKNLYGTVVMDNQNNRISSFYDIVNDNIKEPTPKTIPSMGEILNLQNDVKGLSFFEAGDSKVKNVNIAGRSEVSIRSSFQKTRKTSEEKDASAHRLELSLVEGGAGVDLSAVDGNTPISGWVEKYYHKAPTKQE